MGSFGNSLFPRPYKVLHSCFISHFQISKFSTFCLKEKFEKLENLKILVYQKSKIFKLSNFFNFSFKNWLFFPPLIPSILLCFPPSNVLLLMDEKGDQRRSATWSSCTVSPANYYMKNRRSRRNTQEKRARLHLSVCVIFLDYL